MLFNSYEFIFVFLPATIAGFLVFGRISQAFGLAWLIVASIFFYAWWRPYNLLIIIPSLVVNYTFACILLNVARDEAHNRRKSFILALGIAFNVGMLGYFKYANFAVTVANDLAGSRFVLEHIILPLGISFIAFQKIAFLIDVAGRRIESFKLRDFLLFVLFFPQLVAGPIVHYREVVPQFQRATCRFNAEMFSVAITLFCFGLFKKVVLADGIAQYVSPVFAYAAAGEPVTFLQAWLAAVGFTLQIYFDFSAYSDMAYGAALFFGIRLPLNFDSPLKATNIIDFWSRWHITLTRFLTAYIFNPIALALTRRRAAHGLPVLGGRNSSMGAFLFVLALPTLTTMLVSGAWHGAGYTFILWGLLHGLYLIVNHAWRQYGISLTKSKDVWAPVAYFARLAGFALTFFAVVCSMVLFRAQDIASALNVFQGMIGLHGISLPSGLAKLAGTPSVAPMMVLTGEVDTRSFAAAVAYLVGLLAIALLLPNTLQVTSKYEPALQIPKRPPTVADIGQEVSWRPTLPWMAFVAVLAALAMEHMMGNSEFLYWQF